MEITATAGHLNGQERREMSIFESLRGLWHKHRWAYYYRRVEREFLGVKYLWMVVVARRCEECYKYEKRMIWRGIIEWERMNEEEIKILREKVCMGEIFKRVGLER